MKTSPIIASLVVIALLVGGVWYFKHNKTVVPVPVTTSTDTGTGTDTSSTTTAELPIKITSPLPNGGVKSPLAITGEAKGNWYFEASFPVKIYDANGRLLGQGVAQAQGDWMTTDFVPFKSTLTFSLPITTTGTLVLEKDNPSGLVSNSAELRIPVEFSDTATTTMRTIKLYYYEAAKDKDAYGNPRCTASGLTAVNRSVPVTNTPIQDALRLLLQGGLTSAEQAQGLSTEFPLAGVTLTSASLANSALTLAVSDPQRKTSGGSCRVSILRAEVEATAKQFGGVNTVSYSPPSVFQP